MSRLWVDAVVSRIYGSIQEFVEHGNGDHGSSCKVHEALCMSTRIVIFRRGKDHCGAGQSGPDMVADLLHAVSAMYNC